MASSLRERIWETQWAFSRTVILRAGIQLGVFDAIQAGDRTVAGVSRRCRASREGIRRLLEALVAMGFLRGRDGGFRLPRDAERYLVRGKPDYLGGILFRSGRLMETWTLLPRAIASGRPAQKLDVATRAKRFYPELAAALYSATLETAEITARKLGAGRGIGNLRILDVAAGSAVWSLAFASRDPGARVTAIDLPPVLRVTRRFVRKNGLTRRYRFLPGDIRRVDFGREAYDLVILGQICHSEGPVWTPRLLRKAARALVSRGHLVITDFLPNDRRTGPLFPLQFSLNMFLLTSEGDTFRMADFRNWLRGAGFGPPRRVGGIPPPACVLHARKK